MFKLSWSRCFTILIVTLTCRETGSEDDAAVDDGHVTGSGRVAGAGTTAVCWCLLLTLAVAACLPGAVTSVEPHARRRTPWRYASVPRLDVKVYPRHSVLAPRHAVTIECSVRSVTHVHKSRLRVGFYVRISIYNVCTRTTSLKSEKSKGGV